MPSGPEWQLNTPLQSKEETNNCNAGKLSGSMQWQNDTAITKTKTAIRDAHTVIKLDNVPIYSLKNLFTRSLAVQSNWRRVTSK